MKIMSMLRVKCQRHTVRCLFVAMLVFCSAFVSYHITNGVEMSRAPSIRKCIDYFFKKIFQIKALSTRISLILQTLKAIILQNNLI